MSHYNAKMAFPEGRYRDVSYTEGVFYLSLFAIQEESLLLKLLQIEMPPE